MTVVMTMQKLSDRLATIQVIDVRRRSAFDASTEMIAPDRYPLSVIFKNNH